MVDVNDLTADKGKTGMAFAIGANKEFPLKPKGLIRIKNTNFNNIQQQKYYSSDGNKQNSIDIQIKVKTSDELKKVTSFFKNDKNVNINIE